MEYLRSFHVMSLICEFLETSSFPLATSFVAVTILCALIGAYVIRGRRHVTSGRVAGAVVPESVNYHFTRQCNYKCGFCFHTAKSSYLLDISDAKRGLELLKNAGHIHSRTSLICVTGAVGFPPPAWVWVSLALYCPLASDLWLKGI